MDLWHEQEKRDLLQLRIFSVYCPGEVNIGGGLTVNILRHHCTYNQVNVFFG
jgi:hypothetical protein